MVMATRPMLAPMTKILSSQQKWNVLTVVDQFLGQCQRLADGAVLQQHAELVSAEACQHVVFAHPGLQHAR